MLEILVMLYAGNDDDNDRCLFGLTSQHSVVPIVDVCEIKCAYFSIHDGVQNYQSLSRGGNSV